METKQTAEEYLQSKIETKTVRSIGGDCAYGIIDVEDAKIYAEMRIQEALRWIPVDERLPDNGTQFIARHPARYCDDFDWYYQIGEINSLTTHWRKID